MLQESVAAAGNPACAAATRAMHFRHGSVPHKSDDRLEPWAHAASPPAAVDPWGGVRVGATAMDA